jgi:hypothetical protein
MEEDWSGLHPAVDGERSKMMMMMFETLHLCNDLLLMPNSFP